MRPTFSDEDTKSFKVPKNVNGSQVDDKVSWVIVLAGGNGEFMRQKTRIWFGEERPEQFCCFSGSRTLLEQTWKRAQRLVPDERIVTVVLAHQQHYIEELPKEVVPGTVLYQSKHFGTAPAIMMAVAYIHAQDDNAAVLVLPSIHFFPDEQLFSEFALLALNNVNQNNAKVILFGTEATWSNLDCHWIDTSPRDENRKKFYCDPHGLSEVRGIHCNPGTSLSQRLFRRNAMWNTSIFAAKTRLLWQLCEFQLPVLFKRAEHIHKVMRYFKNFAEGEDYIRMAVRHADHQLPASDIFNDLLKHTPSDCLALRMSNIEWVDWGRPERVLQTIQKYDLRPNFELGHASA